MQIFSGIPTEAECSQACEDFIGCTNYTYLGEKNPLRSVEQYDWKDYTRDEINFRFVCFLLSSCDDISTNCEDCHAGVPQCQVSVVNYLSSS